MSKKINELETVTSINNDDIFVISQPPNFDDSKQITKENIFADTEAEIKNSLGTDEYDNTSTYDVGDYCIYNNTLYKCTTEISTAENFNSNHWEQKKILVELENIKSNLEEYINLKKNIITAGLASNYTISTSGEQTLNIGTIFSQVGDKFSLSNGAIIVGDGIHHILIDAHFFMAVANTGGSKNFYIKLNETEIAYDMNSGISANTNVSRAISSKLIAVNSGDSIKIGIYGSVGDVINSVNQRNYITVQVVD